MLQDPHSSTKISRDPTMTHDPVPPFRGISNTIVVVSNTIVVDVSAAGGALSENETEVDREVISLYVVEVQDKDKNAPAGEGGILRQTAGLITEEGVKDM